MTWENKGSTPETLLWLKPPPPSPGTMEKQGQNTARGASSNQELCCQNARYWASSLPVAAAVVVAVGNAVTVWSVPDLRRVPLFPTANVNGSGGCWVSLEVEAAANRQATCGWVLSRLWLHAARLDWGPTPPLHFPRQPPGQELSFQSLGSTAEENDKQGTRGDGAVWTAPASPQLQARERMAALMLLPTALKHSPLKMI